MRLAFWLLLLVPLSAVLAYVVHAPAVVTFGVAAASIIPLAEWIRRATEHLARLAGPAVGGLVNVTFGNVAELILALFVLRGGETEVVKGQITGSIIGNSLLGLGIAILVGSWGRTRQRFARETASLQSSLLLLSVIALLLPALFDYTERALFAAQNAARLDEELSLGVSAVLIVVYLANVVHTLLTRQDAFEDAKTGGAEAAPSWRPWTAATVLVLATAAVAFEAELVSGALASTASALGLTRLFLGVVVLAVIGNAAEYLTAVYFARRGRMDLTLSITVGSTIQVALLTAPVLVLVSWFMQTRMTLVFTNPLELIAVAAVAFIVRSIAQDGETMWLEGVLLLAVYALLGLAFFFATPSERPVTAAAVHAGRAP